ncbi:MAG TPA: ABC transporter permease [Candidatus Saccharimonadales bacterium]|nr:ABC transporter permease [Candidatus Saccharimonadales bacterium]
MRLVDSIRRSGRNLRHAKLRTILTMAAISIGAFALMLTLAAGKGAQLFVDRLVSSNFNPKTIYVYRDTSTKDNPFAASDDQPQEYNGTTSTTATASPTGVTAQQYLHQDDLDKIAKIAKVDHVSPTLQLTVDYVTAPGAKKFQTQVVSDDAGAQYESLAGTIPAKLQDSQVILPETYLGALGFSSPQSAIGKSLTIQFSKGVNGDIPAQQFTIVAVAKKPNGLLGGAKDVVLAQHAMSEIYKQQRSEADPVYLTALIYAKDGNDDTLMSIKDTLSDQNYKALSAKDVAQSITMVVHIVQYFVAGFGVIALFVSIFGVVNTQLISVLERTREIGLMKALGMSGAGILRLFTFEAAWIGFGGASIGIFLAFLASIFANPMITDKLNLGGNLLIFKAGDVLRLIISLMIIAALAGLLPAWKAARLNPIEALRTE